MIRKALFLAVALATAASAKADPKSMTAEEARHLISRTGFGAAPHEITAMMGQSYEQAVKDIIMGLRTEPLLPMPSWTRDWAYPYNEIWTLDQTRVELFYTNRWIEMEELSAWWIAEMAATSSPLTERLVLMWSDHFANSFEGHENSQWMAQQNAFLRANAAGNFAALANGMLRDPSMLEFLDNTSNVAEAPNENLGREFLELFTLGEGRGYDQDDVRAAARMLTGLTVSDNGTPRTVFDPDIHDDGPKEIFGQTGRFDVDDLMTLTLQNPDFGPYIVEKLWRTFISDQPDAAEVARLSQIWKANDLEMKPLLEAFFLTDAFWDPANRGRIVKSPLEMVVGTARSLGITIPDARSINWIAEELGQMPFLPPNVGGWPEGIDWINDATATGRATALTYLLTEAQEAEDFASSSMMMAAAPAAAPVNLKPEDLRIGQVFSTYIEQRDPGQGYGGYFVLHDVGFGGQDWRSISFWMEYIEDENLTGLYIDTRDCVPDCFASLPSDDDDKGWVAFEPWDELLQDSTHLARADVGLMQALGAHLPQIIAATADQSPFQLDPVDPEHKASDIGPFIRAAELFAASSADVLGQATGAFVQAQSRQNVLGLAGAEMATNPDDLDAYFDARADANRIAIAPAVTYASARDWLDALPGQGPESARAAKALLAVPRAVQGQRDEMVVADPEALLRRLILSPAYQVK